MVKKVKTESLIDFEAILKQANIEGKMAKIIGEKHQEELLSIALGSLMTFQGLPEKEKDKEDMLAPFFFSVCLFAFHKGYKAGQRGVRSNG